MIWEISVSSSQFFCKSKIALKICLKNKVIEQEPENIIGTKKCLTQVCLKTRGLAQSIVKDSFSSIPHLANSHNSNLFCMIYFIRKCDFPQIDECIFACNTNVNTKLLMV